jgi:hypothetical protein
MHKGLATAPSNSGHLVAQFQHLDKLLCIELCHKFGKSHACQGLLSKDIYQGKFLNSDKQSYQRQTHEKELQMHY